MSAAWLVYALVTGALLALAAAAVEGVARARRWPTRWIWMASMAATLALVARAVPTGAGDTARAVTLAGATAVAAGAAEASPLARLLHDVRTMAESALVSAVVAATRALPPWTAEVAAMSWLAAAAVALTVLALVQLRMRRARRGWPRTELHGRRVRVAPAVGPAVVGLLRPEIVVPHWLLERSAAEQRLVLAHEEEHVRAHDHLVLAGACVLVALVPWHPAAWWSLARLRLAIELDCDARVLGRGVLARTYGEMLIDLAGQCSGFRLGATALADKTSHLERRLLAMRPTTTRFALARAGALCAAAALSLAAACEARLPTSAEIQGMDATSAKAAAEKMGLVEAVHGGAAPVFYVNGALVTAAEAHAIAPNDIATVDVQKAASAGGPATITIRTVAATKDGAKYRSAMPAGAVTPNAPASESKSLHERVSLSDHGFAGVILIDGVRADAAALHNLDPKAIAGIEVVKGAAATEMSSDPAARNGIIKVTTLGRRKAG
jgi:beta-lactamase regulating signal transducer with metallopeptidase domain